MKATAEEWEVRWQQAESLGAAAKLDPRKASDYEQPFSPVAKEGRYVSAPSFPPAVTEDEVPHDYNYIDEEEKGTKETVSLASFMAE